jgi:hypothetical protein
MSDDDVEAGTPVPDPQRETAALTGSGGEFRKGADFFPASADPEPIAPPQAMIAEPPPAVPAEASAPTSPPAESNS